MTPLIIHSDVGFDGTISSKRDISNLKDVTIWTYLLTFGMLLIYGYYCLVPLQSVWSFVSSFVTDLFWILL